MYQCPICNVSPWFSQNRKDMLSHMKVFHKKSPQSGECPYKNCSKNYGDIYTYLNHVEKIHMTNTVAQISQDNKRQASQEDIITSKKICLNHSLNVSTNDQTRLGEELGFTYEFQTSTYNLTLVNFKKQQSERATHVIKDLLAEVSLARSTVKKIISLFNKFQMQSIEHLRKIDLEFSKNKNIDLALKFLQNSFFDVNTEHKIFKTLEKKKALIRPVAKIIDTRLKPTLKKKHGKSVWLHHHTKIQTVPMAKVLTKYLELPNVFTIITDSLNKSANKNHFSSLIDGSSWEKIKSVRPEDLIIPLSIYFDDFEINNPLGSHKKKIGAIYYTVSILPSQFASKLEHWFLAQFHKEEDYKRLGNRRTFANFKNELLQLQKNGIQIKINNSIQKVYFCVGRIIGDNLGLNQMLGFSSGFTATHYCRICTACRKDCQTDSRARENLIRNKIGYEIDIERASETGDRSHGVKERCVFEPVFSICDIMSVDPFHDFQEGLCRYEIGSILNFLIMIDQFVNFDISDLNTNIQQLNISHVNGINIPSQIKDKQIIERKYLKLNGSEMTFIMEYLGILIGKYIPRGNKAWLLYILLRKIFFLVMAPTFTPDDLIKLDNLIDEHHKLYIDLGFGTLKPKHHFLLHYSKVMTMLGPLRYNSAIRGEAVHRNHIRYSRVALSRTDPCYTLAMKNQLTLAQKFVDQKELCNQSSVKIKKKISINDLEDFKSFSSICPVPERHNVNLLSEVNYDDTCYKKGMAVILQIKNNLPVFGEIKYLIETNNSVYFIVNELCTLYLDEHVQAYVVNETKEWLFTEYKNLFDYMPHYPQVIELPVQSYDEDKNSNKSNKKEYEKKKVITSRFL